MGIFNRKWKSSNGEKVIRRKKFKKFKSDSYGTGGWKYSFEGWDAPSEISANEFLKNKKIFRMNHYVIVRAPKGFIEAKLNDMSYNQNYLKFSSLNYWLREVIDANFLSSVEFIYKHLEPEKKIKPKSKKVACVHCGDSKDNVLSIPGFQIFDISSQITYAQCSKCKNSISNKMTTDELLQKIRKYPKKQRDNGVVQL